MKDRIFAVDIGGSKLICGALTPKGDILEVIRTALPADHCAADLLARIRAGFESLKHHGFFACGATIPGLADPATGMWIYSPFSGISDIPMTELLTKLTGLPAYIDNDVNMSALAERQFGACQSTDDFIWITVSNGIGGGLFLDGRLYRGHRMTAGEIGHINVEENTERLCGCGKRGCLEAMASGASISAIYKMRTGHECSAKVIAAEARLGDTEALRIWREAGAYIGKAAAHAVNLLGLETIVLGGGAADAFDLLEPGAKESLDRFVFRQANPAIRLLHSSLGANAALLGCAALVNTEYRKKGEKE